LTNRKSHTGFQNSNGTKIDDLEQGNGHNFVLDFGAKYVKMVKDRSTIPATKLQGC